MDNSALSNLSGYGLGMSIGGTTIPAGALSYPPMIQRKQITTQSDAMNKAITHLQASLKPTMTKDTHIVAWAGGNNQECVSAEDAQTFAKDIVSRHRCKVWIFKAVSAISPKVDVDIETF